MGQTLSEPVTSKNTARCEDLRYLVGSSSMQGWRINMEDAHTHILALHDDAKAAFFAVYDGHGGPKVAQYAGEKLHNKVVSQDSYVKGDYHEALRRAFLEIDEDMLDDDEMKDELAGSTACAVLIRENKCFCANVGDSRAVLSVAGDVQQISFDHKPSNELESARIHAAGGWVEFNRVNGNLALSRALGDFVFKRNENKPAEEQIVTACPDVTEADLSKDHEFLVIACDGIWDVMTNQEVVDFVRPRIAQGIPPQQICEDLMTSCLAPDCQMGGLGCDNMTVVIVCLIEGRTYEELGRLCARPRRHQPHILEAMREAANRHHTATLDENDEDALPSGGGEDEAGGPPAIGGGAPTVPAVGGSTRAVSGGPTKAAASNDGDTTAPTTKKHPLSVETMDGGDGKE